MTVPPIGPVITPVQSPVITPVSRVDGPERLGASSFGNALASALAARSLLAPPAPPAAPVVAPAAAPAAAAPPPTSSSAAPAGGYSNLTGDLDAKPELLSRLNRLAASRGERWTVTSGLRTDAEQAELWARRASNPFPVARPGTSVHRTGLAADVTINGRPIQDVVPADALRAAGIEPLDGDAVHVQLAGTL